MNFMYRLSIEVRARERFGVDRDTAVHIVVAGSPMRIVQLIESARDRGHTRVALYARDSDGWFLSEIEALLGRDVDGWLDVRDAIGEGVEYVVHTGFAS